jgi:VanZ family protein
MYSMLLVATPFVLLQNFLVEEISRLSGSSFELAGRSIPILAVVAVGIAAVMLIIMRNRLSGVRVAGLALVLLMITAAQQVTDFYFDHNFYDLQQNWHYIAYGLFAYMMYRDLAPRKIPMATIMLRTYLIALAFSTFDESFQMNLSSRIFDISDIAKDLLGALMGIVLLYSFTTPLPELKVSWRKLRHRSLAGYVSHPPSLIVLMLSFALLLVCISSLLCEFEYWWQAALITVGGFVLLFGLLHLSRHKPIRDGLIVLVICLVGLQAYFVVRHRSAGIVHNEYLLTVYRGVPVPFFDLMIYPDGSFRLVDKKHQFNSRDIDFFQKQKSDVILIGSGRDGLGGNGFPKSEPVQFIYNPHTQRGTEVIILKTPEACEVFNRLKKEGKSVLFILHNSC